MPQPQPVNRRKRFFIELSRTQLLITVAASLFILSWVFILGIIVGRGIVADTITLALKTQISRLQQEKKALMDKYMLSEPKADEKSGDILKPPLDFNDQLGKKSQEHVVMTAPQPTPPPAGSSSTVQLPAPPVDDGPGKISAASEATAKAGGSPAPVPAPRSPAPSVTTAASQKPAVTAPSPTSPPAPMEKAPKSTAASGSGPTGSFLLQVGSYREENVAQSVAQRLASKGYQPQVSSMDLPEKGGRWFRIRMGSFKTRAEAETVKQKLEQDGFQALVMGK